MSLALYEHANERRVIHPLIVRLTHWINAFAIIIMIASGWKIYDASPIFPFMFPHWMTLGGWLGGALGWHFAAMWLLVGNGLVYLSFGFASGHFRHDFLPLSPAAIWRDFRAALTFRLGASPGEPITGCSGCYTSASCCLASALSFQGWRSGSRSSFIHHRLAWRLRYRANRPFRHDGGHRRLYRRPSGAGGAGPIHAAADDHRPRPRSR